MKKQEDSLKKYFYFEKEKEMAIYSYLCKRKLTRRQKKMLSPSTQFEGYHSWKCYIRSKFQVFSKPSLRELSRCLNLSLRDANKFSTFTQGFWLSFISSFFTLSVNELFNYLQPDVNPIIIFSSILLIVPMLVYLIVSVYDTCSLESQRINFYEDVKEIIDEMIEEV